MCSGAKSWNRFVGEEENDQINSHTDYFPDGIHHSGTNSGAGVGRVELWLEVAKVLLPPGRKIGAEVKAEL